jgi:hypothetical protein
MNSLRGDKGFGSLLTTNCQTAPALPTKPLFPLLFINKPIEERIPKEARETT